jgi:hypothetical protein
MKKLIVALVLSCGASVYAAHSVPFKAAIHQEGIPIGACGPACVTVSLTGTGHASHAGVVEQAGTVNLDFATLTQAGISTSTAADGSTFVVAFGGPLVPGPGGSVTFHGGWSVVSGTGRFQGASGGGTFEGSSSDGVSSVLNLDGTLSNPGNP